MYNLCLIYYSLLSYEKTIYFTKTKLNLLSFFNLTLTLIPILLLLFYWWCLRLRQAFISDFTAKVRPFYVVVLIFRRKTSKKASILDICQCMCAHTLHFSMFICVWERDAIDHDFTLLSNLQKRTWKCAHETLRMYHYVSFCVLLCFLFYALFLIVKCYEMPVFKAFFGYFPYFSEENVHFFRKKFVCEGAIL